MLDVVLDTNVLVASLRSKRGASHRILQSVGTGQWQLNISVALALEYEDVMKRPDLLPGFSEADVDGFLDYLFSASNLVPFVPARGLVCLIQTTIVSWRWLFSVGRLS